MPRAPGVPWTTATLSVAAAAGAPGTVDSTMVAVAAAVAAVAPADSCCSSRTAAGTVGCCWGR